MRIGEASKVSGLPAKTIRYYEKTELIGAASRAGASYRTFGEEDIGTLRFLRRARDLGFSTLHMRELLSLWQDRSRESGAVKRIALSHVASLKSTVAGLEHIISTLRALAEACEGDHRPTCPIIDELAAIGPPPAPRSNESAHLRLRVSRSRQGAAVTSRREDRRR